MYRYMGVSPVLFDIFVPITKADVIRPKLTRSPEKN
jgi:hypothetical protein